MICVGARSFAGAKSALENATKRLSELGLIKSVKIAPKLQNIVATANIGQAIDVEALSKKLQHVMYEPEQFPAAIYHAEELEGASVLIFSSGRVVFAGLKSHSLLEVAKRTLQELAQYG